MTPDSGKEKVEKPPEHTVCPEGEHILRVKQLRPVKFTKADSSDSSASSASSSSSSSSSASAAKKGASDAKSGEAGGATATATALVSGVKNRFVCPSCHRGLSNVIKLSCLSKCGHVLCNHCVDTFVRKDKTCVHCSESVSNLDKDIIPMAFGGMCPDPPAWFGGCLFFSVFTLVRSCSGTGFAAHGAKTITRKDAPSFLSG